jgi:1-acyl-sn-glycerol-3-phosphate acyltransferase
MKPTLTWKLTRTIVRIGTSVYFDLKVYGAGNVPPEGGALMVSNHESYLDPVLIGTQLYRPMSYMAKSELFENKVFGAIIRALNAFPVRQGAGDVGAVKETIRRLQEGHLLNIFPEGSRTEDGRLGPIQPGAALVVRRAEVPVIPVVIDGSYRAWPRDRSIFRATPIRVLYGPPMELAGMKAAVITALIDRTFREMLDDLRGGRLEKYTKTPLRYRA